MKKGQMAIKSVQVSVDAASKETHEGIRIGGLFDTLMNNLAFISRLRNQNIIEEFIISFVVSAINFNEMHDFVELWMRLGCDQVYFSCLVDWGVLSKEEYTDLAVHLPGHKMHNEFKKKLQDKVFSNPIVMLGNIGKFKPKEILRDSLFS
jgi:wyosine [tRNA(Phe)-imidazoG37] synthetase (radical SAM superfamily)